MTKHSFVIVSNRLPIKAEKKDGKLVYAKTSGGLGTAMSSLKEDDMVWVGWTGAPCDDLTSKDKQEIREEFAKHGAAPVFLTKAQIENFYEGYANDTLWPLFHYFQSLSLHNDAYWEAYEEVNKLYQAAVKQVAQTDARIWIHDYQLMLLPQLVREELPKSTIGFFLHIPFPSFEIFRLLPERHTLLTGLMGADIVGFHTYDYGRHFLSTVRRLLGVEPHESQIEYGDRVVYVGTYPIGIDYKRFVKTAKRPAVTKLARSIRRHYATQKIILSIDRLDYSKGIPQRLEAYQLLLAEHPEYRGKVVLQMVAVPSRTGVEAYQQLRDQIERAVARINGLYGTADWAPISYQFQDRPFEEIVAEYATADVMLVTPIRDGMNLVAKEYVASSQNHHGVLVLSELAGAADELSGALLVNPNSPRSIATALDEALSMSLREQAKRLKCMQQRLERYNVFVWANAFIDDMKLTQSGERTAHDVLLTPERRGELVRDFTAASKRLIVLDYDGTLKPFQASPSTLAGLPSLKIRLLLTLLSQKKSTHVAIVSGRPRSSLALWFKGIKIDLGAEHGARMRVDGKWISEVNTIKKAKPMIKRVMEAYTSSTPGSRMEEKEYSMVWHYRNVVPELAFNRSNKLRQELFSLIDRDEVDIHIGDKILEVKQRNVNKAHVIQTLIDTYQPDFVLCAGDDVTDEDMFRAVSGKAYTVKVGSGHTDARYRVPDIEALVSLLTRLAGQRAVAKMLRHPIRSVLRRKP